MTVGIKTFTSDPGLGQGFNVQGFRVQRSKVRSSGGVAILMGPALWNVYPVEFCK